jgi:hypoxanthine phosphoribosyltransferase
MREQLGKIFFTQEEITGRVREIAGEINRLYAGEQVVAICVLKGAFMFFADLIKHITVCPELDFVRIASYGKSSSSNKAISFTKDIELSLQNKHVLIVEDIVDTGHSMHFLLGQMQARGAKSIKICALIDKQERREIAVTVDFSGFKLVNGFLVGYGLDYAEKYREIPEIRLLEFFGQ